MQSLNLDYYNTNITDNGIKHMIQMQDLRCYCNKKITDNGIKNMTQIQILYCNENVTDNGIKHMTQIRELCWVIIKYNR